MAMGNWVQPISNSQTKILHASKLTRFNKIAIKGKGSDGKCTRKPLAYREPNNFSSMCNLPCRDVSTLFLNIFTLLAFTQSVDNLFNSFIVLCENEYFLISNLH